MYLPYLYFWSSLSAAMYSHPTGSRPAQTAQKMSQTVCMPVVKRLRYYFPRVMLVLSGGWGTLNEKDMLCRVILMFLWSLDEVEAPLLWILPYELDYACQIALFAVG